MLRGSLKGLVTITIFISEYATVDLVFSPQVMRSIFTHFIKIYDRFPELVLCFVEVSHANLAEIPIIGLEDSCIQHHEEFENIPRVVLVEVRSMVMLR